MSSSSVLNYGIDRGSGRYYMELKVYKKGMEYTCYASAEGYDLQHNIMIDFTLDFLGKDKNNVMFPYEHRIFQEIHETCEDQFYALADTENLNRNRSFH